jgi:hypothetical protein
VVVLAVLLPCTTWCIPHLGVSCVDHNSSGIGAIAHNSNSGNSSSKSCNISNNSSSTVPLLHRRSRLPSGHHSSFPPATFHASTVERWATWLESAACLSKATHQELRHLWSISRGAIRRVLHHERAAPTTPWRDSHERRSASRYAITILFDSRASHDFMSFTCAKKAKLSLVASRAPYVISTPGG